jgi:hypothetical protein
MDLIIILVNLLFAFLFIWDNFTVTPQQKWLNKKEDEYNKIKEKINKKCKINTRKFTIFTKQLQMQKLYQNKIEKIESQIKKFILFYYFIEFIYFIYLFFIIRFIVSHSAMNVALINITISILSSNSTFKNELNIDMKKLNKSLALFNSFYLIYISYKIIGGI